MRAPDKSVLPEPSQNLKIESMNTQQLIEHHQKLSKELGAAVVTLRDLRETKKRLQSEMSMCSTEIERLTERINRFTGDIGNIHGRLLKD